MSSDPWSDLDRLRAHVWDRLRRGADDADDAFRIVTLATVGADGPQLRQVALRAADPGVAVVEIHTDVRTAKVVELRADPRAQILLWDDATREQLRLSARLDVVAADPARWARVPNAARLNYGTDPAPGTPIPDPDALTRRADVARFAALVGPVLRIDAVSLAHDPHRRAVLTPDAARWVAP